MDAFGHGGPRRGRWGVAAIACILAGTSSPAWADHCDTTAMMELLISDADVPRDFEIAPDVTGELDQARLRQFAPGQDVSAFEQLCGYARVWASPLGDAIQATVFDLRSDRGARSFFSVLTSTQSRVQRFDVPDVTGEFAVVVGEADVASGRRTPVTFLRSGQYVVTLAVTAAEADVEIASQLTAAQAARAPSGSEGGGEPLDWTTITAQMSGSFVGAVALYLGAISALARWRDPLRRRRRRRSPGSEGDARSAAVDVSHRTRNGRRTARISFAAQVFGASLLLPGLLPAFWPGSLILLVAGGALVARLPSRLRRRSNRSRRPSRDMFTGRRTVRVTVLYGVALVLLVVAAGLAIASMLQSQQDGPLVITEQSGDHFVIESETLTVLPYGLAVIAVGGAVAVSRRARRLAALDARALIERDERPVVLYLRSFTDDDLRIRSSVTGRRSLVEQLSPRRFDRFEEMLAWRLNDIGPVVALNPPDTKLSPIGAARTTLGNDEWQHTIDEWMMEATVIVVAAPPSHVTPGLRWELDRIQREDLWSKTVFVLPPVPDDDLRHRWEGFAPLLKDAAPWADAMPGDPAAVLAARVEPGRGWSVVIADERSEWSYAEGLEEAIGFGRGTPRAPSGGSPTRRDLA